jgi:membrane fusion protein, multidrug efflux system
MRHRVLCRATLVALVTMMVAGCQRAAAPAPGGSGAAEPAPRPAAAENAVPSVTVARPAQTALEIEIEAPGTLIPQDEAGIAAQSAGPVTEVRVEEGSRVGQGDVLVRLETTKAELAVRQADAALAQARANSEKAKAELARKDTLLADRTIAQGTYETFKSQNEAAAAAVDGAETAVALARQRLKELTIISPFAGVIREKRVSIGQYVKEGETLVVLMRVDPLKLQFDVPEKYSARLAVGHEVRATVVALPGQVFTGTIVNVFPSVAVQSRTVRVEARVPNPAYRLKPGFYASVRVPIARLAGSVVVPQTALVRQEGTERVFVLKDGRADLVRVETGVETKESVEIVLGLTPADQVIVSGGGTLKPGDRVNVGS